MLSALGSQNWPAFAHVGATGATAPPVGGTGAKVAAGGACVASWPSAWRCEIHRLGGWQARTGAGDDLTYWYMDVHS